MVMSKDQDWVDASASDVVAVEDSEQDVVEVAKSRLQKYVHQIEGQGVNGKRPVRWVKKYSLGVPERAADAISNTVNSFLGIVEDVEDSAKRVLDGFKRDIETGLYAILSNDKIGEHEEERTFEFVHHHALVCVDVKFWRCNFLTAKGEPNSLLSYVFCKSVMDRKALSPDQLAYLLTEHAGDKNIEEYMSKLVGIWTQMGSMPEGVMSPTEEQIQMIEKAENKEEEV